jgi:uncharacterized protein (DUF2384 family)
VLHSRPEEGERVIEIRRSAVDATHAFLDPEDRLAIDEMVCCFLPQAQFAARKGLPSQPVVRKATTAVPLVQEESGRLPCV